MCVAGGIWLWVYAGFDMDMNALDTAQVYQPKSIWAKKTYSQFQLAAVHIYIHIKRVICLDDDR